MRFREPLRDIQCHWTKQCRIDAVVHKSGRSPVDGRNRPQGRDFGEVARQHCRSRHESFGIHGVRARWGALVATEKEQLVADNRPTKRPTELIALQRAVHSLACFRIHRRKIRCSVEQIVAHELERIAVELVRPGLRHRTNLGTRGQTLRGRQATGLHLKLLERVRKWKGQTQIVIPIGMQRAIQRIGDTTRETASHSNVRLVLHAST